MDIGSSDDNRETFVSDAFVSDASDESLPPVFNQEALVSDVHDEMELEQADAENNGLEDQNEAMGNKNKKKLFLINNNHNSLFRSGFPTLS